MSFSPELLALDLALAPDFSNKNLAPIAKQHGQKEKDVSSENRGYIRITKLALASLGKDIPAEAVSQGAPAFSSKYQDYRLACSKLETFLSGGTIPGYKGNVIDFLRKHRPDGDPNKQANVFTVDWEQLVFSTYPHLPLKMLISHNRITTHKRTFMGHVDQQRTDNEQVAQFLYGQLGTGGAQLLNPDRECHMAMRIHSIGAVMGPASTWISWDELMLDYGDHFPEQRGRIDTIFSQLAPFYSLTRNHIAKQLRLPFDRRGRPLMSFQDYVREISYEQIGKAFSCSLNQEVKECFSDFFKKSDLCRRDCLEFLTHPKQELPCDKVEKLKKDLKYELIISCRVIMNYLNEQIHPSMQSNAFASDLNKDAAINELILWTFKRKKDNYHHKFDSYHFPKVHDPPLSDFVTYVKWVNGLAPFYSEPFLPNALCLLLSLRGLNDRDGLREKGTREAFMNFVNRCCGLPYVVLTTKAVIDCSIHERDKTFREKLEELDMLLPHFPPNLTGKAPRFFDWISKKNINSEVKDLIKQACSGQSGLIEWRLTQTGQQKINQHGIQLFISKIDSFNTEIGLHHLKSEKGKEKEGAATQQIDAHLYFEALFAFLDGKVQNGSTAYADRLLSEFQENPQPVSLWNSVQKTALNLFPSNQNSDDHSFKKNEFELLRLYDSIEDRLKMIPLIAQAAEKGVYKQSEHAKFISAITHIQGHLTNPTDRFFEIVGQSRNVKQLQEKIQELNEVIEIAKKTQKLKSDVYFNILAGLLAGTITTDHLNIVTRLYSWELGRAEMLECLPLVLTMFPISEKSIWFPLQLVEQMPRTLTSPTPGFFSLIHTCENTRSTLEKVEKFNKLINTADASINSYIYYSTLELFLREAPNPSLTEEELQLVQLYDPEWDKKEAMLKVILAAYESESFQDLKDKLQNFIQLTELLPKQKLSAPTPALLRFSFKNFHDPANMINQFNVLLNMEQEEEVDYALYLKGVQLFLDDHINEQDLDLSIRDADTRLRSLIQATNVPSNRDAIRSNRDALQEAITAFEKLFEKTSLNSKRALSTHQLSPLKLPLSEQQLQQAKHVVACNRSRLSEEEQLYLFYERLAFPIANWGEASPLSINDQLMDEIARFTGFAIDGSTFCYFLTYRPNFDQKKVFELLRDLYQVRLELFQHKTFFAEEIVRKIKKTITAFTSSIEERDRSEELAKERVPPQERLDMIGSYLRSATLPLVMSADSIPISSAEKRLYFSPSSPHQQCQLASHACRVGRYEMWIKEGNYYRYCVNCFSPDMSRNAQGSARLVVTTEIVDSITTLWPLIQELLILLMNQELSQKNAPESWKQLVTGDDRAVLRWKMFANSYLRLKEPPLPIVELESVLMQFFVDLKQALRWAPIALATSQQPASFNDPIVAAASGTMSWNQKEQAHQIVPSSLLQATTDHQQFFTTAAEMKKIQKQSRNSFFRMEEIPLFVTQNGIEALPLHFNIIQKLVNEDNLSIELTTNQSDLNIFATYPRDIADSDEKHRRAMSWQLGLLKTVAYQSLQIEGMEKDE